MVGFVLAQKWDYTKWVVPTLKDSLFVWIYSHKGAFWLKSIMKPSSASWTLFWGLLEDHCLTLPCPLANLASSARLQTGERKFSTPHPGFSDLQLSNGCFFLIPSLSKFSWSSPKQKSQTAEPVCYLCMYWCLSQLAAVPRSLQLYSYTKGELCLCICFARLTLAAHIRGPRFNYKFN